ncbi:MAG: LysR family transcriptional regulator [Colwellia sp.]|nr:LysR family transcriptional regulator [Colwellia sp.]
MTHKLNHLYLMELFVAIVQHGSFTGAAKQLGITATKASKDVQYLEKSINTILLNRTTRSIHLTDAGEVYLNSALDILELHSQMIDNIDVMKTSLSGELRITAPVLWGEVVLAPLILVFNKKYPKVRFVADFSNEPIDIFRENIHIAFRSTELKNEPYLARYICKDEYVLCASREYLQRNTNTNTKIKSLVDLDDHQVIIFTQKGSVIDRFDFIYQQQSIQHHVKGSLSFNNKKAIHQAVIMDSGIAVLPKYLVAKELSSGEVIEVLPDHQIKSSSFYALYTQRRKESILVNTFIDFVQEKIDLG